MRSQIRDAAFVIVDLTHDNSGAYWEAGYAEGLGKPVIYICEKAKFDKAKTHFDTNHCTTVVWTREKGEEFRAELIATLRRSLNLFAPVSQRSEEHTSELQSLMRISYAVFCLKKKNNSTRHTLAIEAWLQSYA